MAFEKRKYTIRGSNVSGSLNKTIPASRILHKMRVGSLKEDSDSVQWGDNGFGLRYSGISNLLLVV